MKQPNSIFKNLRLGSALLFALCALPTFAANDGCGDNNNERINPDIALCSVHAYNVGSPNNPTTPSEKQQMDEVVALKTTIMTQQMKKQYDFLEVTVSRFKTQLKKAILISQMEAAGAATSDSASSGKSTNKNIVLSGARDCNNLFTNTEVLSCLGENLNNIASSSDKTNARKQLQVDVDVFNNMASTDNKTTKCKSLTNTTMTECINEYRGKIRNQTDAANKKQSGGYMMMPSNP